MISAATTTTGIFVVDSTVFFLGLCKTEQTQKIIRLISVLKRQWRRPLLSFRRRPGGQMGSRSITPRTCIPDLLLTIYASTFGFSVIFSVLALITIASNLNKLRNAIGA